jgi:DNA modification methylase
MTDYIIPALREHAVPVGDLRLDPANANMHPEKNLEAIKDSLAAFGQRQVILARKDNNTVIAGNGRLLAARALGWSHIACVFVDDDDMTAVRYAIADNRTSELSEWDNDVLSMLLSTIKEDLGSLDGTGFDDGDLDDLLSDIAGGGEKALDEFEEAPEAPEVLAEPVSVRGDVWILGEHRVMCGDCRDSADVSKLLDGAQINIAFTSPPYASQRKYDEDSGFKPVHPDAYVDWFCAVQDNVRKNLADDGSWFVNIKEHAEDGQRHLYVKDLTIAHVRQWGWLFKDELCWYKKSMPGTWPDRFRNDWEPIFHFSLLKAIKFDALSVGHKSDCVRSYSKGLPKGETFSGNIGLPQDQKMHHGVARPGNVIEISVRENINNNSHPAAFPVGLPLFFIKAFSDKSDAIYEPFCGSGSTLIAAEQLGRKCYGMEISPNYVDVIVRRWQEFTGERAVHEDGRIFDEITQ